MVRETIDLEHPATALDELKRRIAMELGVLPPPPGTRRIERRFSLALRGSSINRLPPGSLAFSRAKEDLQGRLMREMHKLHTLLPRPIPSVGHTGQIAPVFAHARACFNRPARRDLGNFGSLVEKAWGDACVGPEWKGQPTKGQKRIPANRWMIYQGAAYEGGWLTDDGERNWLFFFDFAARLGDPSLTLTLVWDEPLDAGTAY